MSRRSDAGAWREEVLQFRLLVRLSLGRMLHAAVGSRDVDAVQFAIWSFALVATPPLFYAAKTMRTYMLHPRIPELLERTVLLDRLFFIVYMMLAAALLAAVLWNALFPDRQDQEVIGVLPVRARTIAAARLAAALGVGALFALAIAIPSGFVFAVNAASAHGARAVIGWLPVVFVAHAAAVAAAGVFAFALLLAMRGAAVACVGAAAVERAAVVLQLVTVVLVAEALIFLPGLLAAVAAHVESEGPRSPLVWFLAVAAMASPHHHAQAADLAARAAAAVPGSVLIAAALYLLPARWNARRAIEAPMRDSAGRTVAIAERLASPLLSQSASRAVFAFVLASLARSSRHLLIVVMYLGVAVAVAAIRVTGEVVRDQPLALHEPLDYLVAIPMVITFFLVVGLRAAFAVPTDPEANWTFRLAQPRSTASCVHAVAVAMFVVAVMPVSLLWLIVTASLWDAWSAIAGTAMHAASGAMLIELTLIGYRAVPFTRAHAASSSSVRVGWIVILVGLYVFAFRLDDLQLAALDVPAGVVLYLLGAIGACAAVRAYRRAQQRPWDVLEFDAPDHTPATLNLSQA
jgi:hypothetical protein